MAVFKSLYWTDSFKKICVFCESGIHFVSQYYCFKTYWNLLLLRSIQVDHQLFVLSKLDITGDGRDEIVACAWDGQTYILDQEKRSVRFQLEEPVSGFCAGRYTLKSGSIPVPCFIYTTFTNKVNINKNILSSRILSHLEYTKIQYSYIFII